MTRVLFYLISLRSLRQQKRIFIHFLYLEIQKHSYFPNDYHHIFSSNLQINNLVVDILALYWSERWLPVEIFTTSIARGYTFSLVNGILPIVWWHSINQYSSHDYKWPHKQIPSRLIILLLTWKMKQFTKKCLFSIVSFSFSIWYIDVNGNDMRLYI
jgi:hypothetical protein